MKKYSIGSKMLSTLLVLAMTLSILPVGVFAAEVGTLANVDTGLTGDIDKTDTISLPIKILDYEADGMLFEFAEANAQVSGRAVGEAKKAEDFGATWAADFASQTAVGNIGTSMYGDFWTNTTKTLNTSNSYASYLRATWAKNSTQAPHTVYGRTGVIMPNDLNLSMDNARYLVMVYRSNVASGKIGFFVERANSDRSQTRNRVGDLTFTNKGDTGEGSTTNWTYAVYDLKQGNLANNWTGYGNATAVWTTLPMDAPGEYIDLAHVALFANAEQAKEFGEYALTDGSDRGDNRGFGLLRSSRKQQATDNTSNNFVDSVADEVDSVKQLNTYSTTYADGLDFSTITTLGYTLLGKFGYRGIANVGLLESSLSEEGYPVYKQEVVTYVANLLKHSLEIPERTDGWKNYRYVKGTASSVYGDIDLATALRNRINGNMGTYAAASGKDLVGTWGEVDQNIKSYYDAAYFLLNSIFFPGSYNELKEDYNYLVLSAGTDSETGDKVYVFDGGFTNSTDPASAQMAIAYNTTDHTIQNTSAAGKSHFYHESNSTTTLNPFLPVTDRNKAGMMTPYYQDDGVINGVKKQKTKDTLYERNFNFAMVSEGEFVYHADDELFFEFEGDDDVYLFINNELVMDIGSAHSIDSVRFNLNDYVNAAKAGTLGSDARNKALALEEGNTYDFKFYYMERHSYGSNIRICTNIRVTDPKMETVKTAWQDGVQLDFGSVVDPKKVVEYGFAITNNGQENLHNLTFTDTDIGVTLDYTNGLTVGTGKNGKTVFDVNSEDDNNTLEVTDLTAVVTHPDYDDITVTFADNAALIAFLEDLTASGTEAGGGLYIGATVQIRGIGYKLTDAQVKEGVFNNTVLTTSTNNTKSETLHGQASMRVYVPADPMYYEWVDHTLNVTKAKLIDDIMGAIADPNNPLYDENSKLTANNVNKIELVTKAGTAITSPCVTIDGNYNLAINYDTTGSKVFYVKITYNSSKNNIIIPVLVNVTTVKDSVIVLDYGLPVDISVAELTKNDVLVVPGRDTTYEILGFGKDGAYSPNEITFTLNDTATEHNGTYGTFKLNNDNTITYTPKKFIEGADTIQIAYTVYEGNDPSKIVRTLDINNEVEMYKTITIVPANVMYYEDDFNGITYTEKANADKTKTAEDLRQSADQNMPYGYDPVYADGENLDNTDVSGGSLHTIALDGSDIFTFTFIGTGFELIAQTNAKDSGTIVVDKGAPETEDDEPAPTSGSGGTGESALSDAAQLEVLVESTPVVSPLSMSGESLFAAAPSAQTKLYPVIMEFDNGANGGNEAITQVPVIRIDDMAWAIHTVTVRGIQAHDWTTEVEGNTCGGKECGYKHIPTYLYFDGLRIFEPAQNVDEVEKYYLDTEKGAKFHEIRDLIFSNQTAIANYTESGITVATGNVVWSETWAENLNGSYTDITYKMNEVESIEDYLYRGPNNEVYMPGAENNTSAIAFYVVKDPDADVHSLQIAMRAIDFGMANGANATGLSAVVEYGVLDGEVYGWTEAFVTLTSGTEQYYTIDFTKCPVVKIDGKEAYQVVLRVNNDWQMVSYSSLKTVGLDICKISMDGTDLKYDGGIFPETNLSSGAAGNMNSAIFNALTKQLSSNIFIDSDSNKFPTKPSIPETDDPLQNLPETNEPETDDNDTNDGEEESSKPSNFDLLKLFTLTAIAGEGGTITPEGDLIIAFGASRTFKFIPDEGYEIADVLVNGKSVGAVEKYVLKAAHADTVVEVLFREIPEAAADAEAAAEEAAG